MFFLHSATHPNFRHVVPRWCWIKLFLVARCGKSPNSKSSSCMGTGQVAVVPCLRQRETIEVATRLGLGHGTKTAKPKDAESQQASGWVKKRPRCRHPCCAKGSTHLLPIRASCASPKSHQSLGNPWGTRTGATGAAGAAGAAGAEPSDHHKLVQKGHRAPLAAPNPPNLRALDGQRRGHRWCSWKSRRASQWKVLWLPRNSETQNQESPIAVSTTVSLRSWPIIQVVASPGTILMDDGGCKSPKLYVQVLISYHVIDLHIFADLAFKLKTSSGGYTLNTHMTRRLWLSWQVVCRKRWRKNVYNHIIEEGLVFNPSCDKLAQRCHR